MNRKNLQKLMVLSLSALMSFGAAAEADARSRIAPAVAESAFQGIPRDFGVAYETLDADNYRATGDIFLGEAELYPVWDEAMYVQLPKVTWAMGLTHAQQLMTHYEIDIEVNALLAFAAEESALGCDPEVDVITYRPETHKGGCFYITSYEYGDLQSVFPARFASDFEDTISGGNFESSALAFAFQAAMNEAELKLENMEPQAFYDGAVDVDAQLKVVGLTHQLGTKNAHIKRIFDEDRDRCLDESNLAKSPAEYACINNEGTNRYVRTVADHTNTLMSSPEVIYDPAISWADMEAYFASIRSVYPEVDHPSVYHVVRAAFEGTMDENGEISFIEDFGGILDTLILSLPAPEDPREGLVD